MARKLSRKAQEAGYSLVKKVYRIAYAKNGNFDNPTKYYTWQVFKDGQLMGQDDRQSAAIQFAEDLCSGVYDS